MKEIGNTAKKVPSAVAVALFCISLIFSGVGIFSFARVDNAYAGAGTDFICKSRFVPQDVKTAYQYFMSDDDKFDFKSKSNFGPGIQDVDEYWLNVFIDPSKKQFKDVNEKILGRPLVKEGAKENPKQKPPKPEDKFNGGNRVNPYQRFGIAGLTWSGYIGEWKYLKKNVCDDSEPQDPKAGMFYEGRLVPQSVYDDRENSIDIRTRQHLSGFSTDSQNAALNNFANLIFDVAKFVVAITLALINLAFSDIAKVFGINEILAGNGTTEKGIFGSLWDGIFTPLIVPVFAITGIHIGWGAIVKKQYRKSLGTLLRSISLFMIATIISVNPLIWTSIPNDVAILGQSLLISSANGGITADNGLCAMGESTKASDPLVKTKNVSSDAKKQMNILDEAGKTMRGAIGCKFWQQFLLKPWTEGQFGKDWNHTWVKGKAPKWAPKGKEEFDNSPKNQKFVGDAAVPLGNKEFINNWAVFHISTQTNAHAPIGKNGDYGKRSNNFDNDWWRVADALANYQEKTFTIDTQTGKPVEVDDNEEGPSALGTEEKAWPAPTKKMSPKYPGHSGIDFPMPQGTPVYAAMSGTVSDVKIIERSYGHHIKIKYNDGNTAIFGHLSKIDVKPGQKVKRGQTIGKSGSTGRSSGPHLHYEIVPPGSSAGRESNRAATLEHLGMAPDKKENKVVSALGAAIAPDNGPTSETITEPDATVPVSQFWNTWVGNDVNHRLKVAVSAVLVSVIGVSAPLFFGFQAAVLAIGTALITAFAPIMLLFGCWPDKGWNIFKGWGELLANITIKRILAGLLLVLALIFTDVAIKFMDDVNWWMGMIMLALLSLVIVRSKDKIIDSFQKVQFGGVNLTSSANIIGNRAKAASFGSIKTAGRFAKAPVSGSVRSAIDAKKSGLTNKQALKASFKGAGGAAKSELKNLAAKNSVAREALNSYESIKMAQDKKGAVNNVLGSRNCSQCGKLLQNQTSFYRDQYGNALCRECGEDMELQGRVVKEYDIRSFDEQEALEDDEIVNQWSHFGKNEAEKGIQQMSKLANDYKKEKGEKEKDIKGKDFMNEVVKITSHISDDITSHKLIVLKYGKNAKVSLPSVPDQIKEYVDIPTLHQAWSEGNYDFVRYVYTTAWTNFIMDRFSWDFLDLVDSFKDTVNKNIEEGISERDKKNRENVSKGTFKNNFEKVVFPDMKNKQGNKNKKDRG